jgi:hypothetical protein
VNWQKTFGLTLVSSDRYHSNIGIITSLCNGAARLLCFITLYAFLCTYVLLQDILGPDVRQVRIQTLHAHHRDNINSYYTSLAIVNTPRLCQCILATHYIILPSFRTRLINCETGLGSPHGYFVFNLSRGLCCKLGLCYNNAYIIVWQLAAAVCHSAFGPAYYSANFGLLFTTTFVYNSILIIFTQVSLVNNQ